MIQAASRTDFADSGQKKSRTSRTTIEGPSRRVTVSSSSSVEV